MTAHGLERDDYEALVIGSGFGGAVAACRLAQAGIDVAIVERGRRYPAGSFPRDLTKLDTGWLWSRGQGLFDVRPWGDIICVQAAGYGGGSLVYANVAMRPPAEVFEAFWPHPYRRATLDPYFDLAAHMIGVRPVQPHPVTGALPLKTERLRHLGDSFGHPGSVFQPNLAVTFDEPTRSKDGLTRNRFGVAQAACIHCGECDIGCNVGAKNTLDLNYLALAERHGAQVATLTTATHLEPSKSGYLVHLTSRDSLSGERGQVRRVTAKQVFVCAGALGSTELLLRSRDQYHTLPDLPAALGAGYSGNGDFIAFGSRTNDALRPGDGPTITSAVILRGASGQKPWFLMEDGGYSTHLAGLVRALHPGRLALLETGRLADGMIGSADVGRQGGPEEHSVVLLVMGRDRADGRIRLRGPRQRLQVEWNTAGQLPLYAA